MDNRPFIDTLETRTMVNNARGKMRHTIASNALCCTVLHCVALCCTVLHCVALCCTVFVFFEKPDLCFYQKTDIVAILFHLFSPTHSV